MSNDSHLFRTREQLEREGFRLIGNRFVKNDEVWLPLYEAKMIWHFDHRFGNYETICDRSSTHIPKPVMEQYADLNFTAKPWYWVPLREVEARLAEWKPAWVIGFRRITNATNERTMVSCIFPTCGSSDLLPICLLSNAEALQTSCLVATFNVLSFDYTARQKIGGIHMDFHYLKQLPVLEPGSYNSKSIQFIIPRVLELVYTAWDIKPFADDVWQDADDTLKAEIKKQWEENRTATDGHEWGPLEWAEIPEDSIPLPPFKWDENRRAILKAELDAYYAKLYGLTRKQLRYILDPADLTEKELEDIIDPWEEVEDPLDPEEYAKRVEKSTFPGETFRVLKDKEIRQFGEYRTRRLVLEAWNKICVIK